jgi:TrkA domain protein
MAHPFAGAVPVAAGRMRRPCHWSKPTASLRYRQGMDIHETALPGVGLRHDFTTKAGRQLGVVTHRTGRRDLLVYDRDDPDSCQEVVQLTEDEADALADLLGGDRLVSHLARLQQQIEGLVIDWLEIRPGSPYAGRTIADTQARSRTGVSIVAIVRGDRAIPAPAPDERLEAGDTLVVVGTAQGVRALTGLLGS